MLRIKLAGRTPDPGAAPRGRASSRTTTAGRRRSSRRARTIQLHYLAPRGRCPTSSTRLDAAGLTTLGALRRRGTQRHRLPCRRHRARRAVRRRRRSSTRPRLLLRPPGLRRPAAQAQDLDLAPAPTAATRRRSTASRSSASLRDGERGLRRARRRRALVGAAYRSRARRVRPAGRGDPVLRALLDAWRDDLRYRVSRVKSRIKFMVDDLGPEGMRAEVERRLGYALPRFPLPPHRRRVADHLGVQPQKQEGRCRDRRPRPLGLDLAASSCSRSPPSLEELGGDIARHAAAEPRARERPRREPSTRRSLDCGALGFAARRERRSAAARSRAPASRTATSR